MADFCAEKDCQWFNRWYSEACRQSEHVKTNDASPHPMHAPTPAPTQGLKYNEGKLRWNLLSNYALRGTIRVLMFGVKKYAAWNWSKGLSWTDCIESAKRHLAEVQDGNDLNPEDGNLPHIDQLACEVMFLQHFYHTKTGRDDRAENRGEFKK